ncbi:MAG: phosphatidate cytidylyltransferase [Alphaproteobacteria bacterium]
MAIAISPRLQKRVISASVIIPIVVAGILIGGVPFIILVSLNAAIVMYEWFYLSIRSKHRALFLLAGLFYVLVAFWSCYLIRVDHGIRYALLFVIMIWASDIGGYVFGKVIGGPKMAKTISPNKTWAGFAGAAIFPIIAANIYLHTYDYIYSAQTLDGITRVSLAMFVMGAIIGIVGQAGDLLISWFKRHVEVKDSSALIPGHGGLLDRVDAMMLAAPVYLFFISEFTYAFEN